MMSTPKKNNLWEGIQGYQDGGLFSNLLNYDPVQASKDYYAGQYASEASPLDIKRGAMEGFSPQMVSSPEVSQASGLMDIGRNLPAAIEAPELSLQRPAMEAFSPEGVAYPDMPTPNIMPSPDEEDIINLNYLGRPEEELQGLATEAFGRERNPLTQMLMRSESAAQAGDKRRAAEAVERSRMGYAQDYMSDDAPLDIKRSLMGQFMPEAVSAPDVPEAMSLADIGKKAHGWLGKATADIDAPEDWQYALDQNIKGESLDPAMMKAMPAAPDMTNIMDVAAVTPEMKRQGLDDMIAGALLKGGRGIGSLGSAGAKLAGKGISKGLELAGAGIGAGAQGIGGLLGALAGIPGDISKAYQSYGEGEKYPALAQLMSASQGKIMPNIYASMYKQDGGEIKGYPYGGVVEGDDDYGVGAFDRFGSGSSYGAGAWHAGLGVPPPSAPSAPGSTPGTTYQSGQPTGSGDYMGSDVGYGSMFGADTTAGSSLDQVLANLGYELTPEQRKMYEEYDIGAAEKDIRLSGQRGLLGLTQQRQQQAAGAGFAGGGGGSATGTARRDLLQDISMQQRGKRQAYQEDISSQIAADIAGGADIKEIGDFNTGTEDDWAGNTDVLNPEEVAERNADPNWNPPPSPTDGATYNWNNQEMVWSDEQGDWVTRWDYDQGQAAGQQSDQDLYSDIRVKEDINYLFTLKNNVPIYTYKYKWSDDIQIGTMAQDIEGFMPDAVGERNGIKTVNYNKVFNRN